MANRKGRSNNSGTRNRNKREKIYFSAEDWQGARADAKSRARRSARASRVASVFAVNIVAILVVCVIFFNIFGSLSFSTFHSSVNFGDNPSVDVNLSVVDPNGNVTYTYIDPINGSSTFITRLEKSFDYLYNFVVFPKLLLNGSFESVFVHKTYYFVCVSHDNANFVIIGTDYFGGAFKHDIEVCYTTDTVDFVKYRYTIFSGTYDSCFDESGYKYGATRRILLFDSNDLEYEFKSFSLLIDSSPVSYYDSFDDAYSALQFYLSYNN